MRYLRELRSDDPVRVTFQLFDYDAKRVHYFEELLHAEEGWLSATSENMMLHVDLKARKTAAFPDYILARLARMKAAHAICRFPTAPAGASLCGRRACRRRDRNRAAGVKPSYASKWRRPPHAGCGIEFGDVEKAA